MKTVFFIIGALLLLVAIGTIYYGGLTTVHVQLSTQGGETLVYEEVTGDYKQTGEVSTRVYNDLLQDGVETSKGFGIFYDNPQQVAKSMLRSEVGCILEDAGAVEKLSGKYKTKVFPRKEYITSEFPYKGQLSILVSLFKIYPALCQFAEQQGYGERVGPVMEIYDAPNQKITYRQELYTK